MKGAWVSKMRFSPSGQTVVALDAILSKVFLVKNQEKLQVIHSGEIMSDVTWETDTKCMLSAKKGNQTYILSQTETSEWSLKPEEDKREASAPDTHLEHHTLSTDRKTIIKKEGVGTRENIVLSQQVFEQSGLTRKWPKSFLIQTFDVSADGKTLCFFLLGEEFLFFLT